MPDTSPSPTPQDEVLTDERKAARYDDLEGYLRRRCLEFGLSPEGDYADVACRLRDHMADLTGDLADAKADCLRLHKQFVDAKYPDHRSSPSSAVPDVVREWEENRDPYALSEKHEASLNWAHAKQMATGDRMAAALTAQAKTIETGLMLIHSLAGERDAERATVTELRAEVESRTAYGEIQASEVERLTGDYARVLENMRNEHERAEAAEFKIGQAYQVIGALAERAGLFENPDVQRALDYFSGDTFAEDFLPWALKEKETK